MEAKTGIGDQESKAALDSVSEKKVSRWKIAGQVRWAGVRWGQTLPLRTMIKPESPRLAAWSTPLPMVRMQAVQEPVNNGIKSEILRQEI